MSTYLNLQKDLEKIANKKEAKVLQRFYKTNPGDYGYGDIFLGIKVPKQREVIEKYLDLKLSDIKKLLLSPVHEFRFSALLILVNQYQRAETIKEKERIFKFYFSNSKKINNWDLVDVSAPKIVGDFLLIIKKKDKKQFEELLYSLSGLDNLWQRRIAIVCTLKFLAIGEYKDTIKLAKKLLNDPEDLINKAVGWLLREVGKIKREELVKFLDKYSTKMPRITLRYSIEHFNKEERKYYLNK